jgi:Cd2+/Zn2+-exporting ATPase
LGTPSAILAGVARAARGGVLVKGGMHLENLGQIRAIAFDKTGTITRGKPELTDIALLNGLSREYVLALAAAVESRSAHPLAQAVVRAAQQHNLALPDVTQAEAVTGRGIRAQVNGRAVWAGSPALFTEAGLDLPPSAVEQVAAFEDQGKTAMLVWQKPHFVGVIAVADAIRPDARQAIAALQRLGVSRTLMLTGDNLRVAAHIAQQAGIQEVQANLLPEDKLRAVQALVARHGLAGMVGDGVNDAPALAHATVGVAMGSAGTDVALETADVALMGDDLRRLPFALGLGRATRQVILQNLVIALGVIAILIVVSVMGWASIGVAVVFHEGSTIVVVLNSLRLLTYQDGNG